MTAAFYGQYEAVLAREVDARYNIGNTEAAHDERWPAVDHGIPDGARIIVPRVIRSDQLTAQTLLEFLDGVLLQSNFLVSAGFNLQAGDDLPPFVTSTERNDTRSSLMRALQRREVNSASRGRVYASDHLISYTRMA